MRPFYLPAGVKSFCLALAFAAVGAAIESHVAQIVPAALAAPESPTVVRGEGAPQFSGIYPNLAHFNPSNECGTGAVVPWADRLWVVTYSPHRPNGSADKLYEIDRTLNRTTRPESVGGTPANRMIHRESGQLMIGPYVIDRQRNVRVVSPRAMPGRLTGCARHLSDPQNKIYYATMEEGFYELDVHSLEVAEKDVTTSQRKTSSTPPQSWQLIA